MTTATRRPRRTLTPEQQAASDARRQAFREYARAVSAMSEGERVAMADRAGLRTVEGHELSTTNAVLAIMQRPAASVLGGFNQWRAAGRQVRKGEHGIMIWAPTKNRDEDSDRPGFVPITLFDVAQTDESEASE